VYYYSIPDPLFHDPYTTVLQDRNGELLSATLSADWQWRFPEIDSVPEKYAQAVVAFEDKRFWLHPGVDVLALGRSIGQNIRAGKKISGGSTISMQVIRLSRKNKSRTYTEKIIEMMLATRLELGYSKSEILRLYASHAPYGGNVVGIEAACWRYFGRDIHSISWAEAALLAVLPNSPALIHTGRNREALQQKRDQLLNRLQSRGIIDQTTSELAKAESLPETTAALPRYAHHLLQRMTRDGFKHQRVVSTVDLASQRNVERIVKDHHQRLAGNQIYNIAVLVLDVKSGEVRAYAGNTRVTEPGNHGDAVDIIAAPRSSGSILKPLLFAALLDEGKLLPNTLVSDIPVVFNGFAPKNFSREYDGVVPASQALIRSLNVPAVYMLQQYRYEKFYSLLKQLGMTTLKQLPDHYGLSMILGGAEGTLWDITGIYASMARVLVNYHERPYMQRYDPQDIHPPVYHTNHAVTPSQYGNRPVLSAGAIYQTFDVLKEVYRPGEESGWRNFGSSKRIAWKTGTSFGHRDAWAVGVTPDHAVGVWVGNADGEGRSGLTGSEMAAPILFDIFSFLPGNAWFTAPVTDMDQVVTCVQSGMRLSAFCEQSDTVWTTRRGIEAGICRYHKPIHVTSDKHYRVHQACATPAEITTVNWFVLPPVQEYYFRVKNSFYRALPEFKQGCEPSSSLPVMELVYPKPNTRLFIPRELDGTGGHAIFELAHRQRDATVYWHLDGNYLGSTNQQHRMPIQTAQGKHVLTLVDAHGNTLERHFEALGN
jgi:penicillin-binding protein 1C